jgi:bacterioferritin (cytochrome b1)
LVLSCQISFSALAWGSSLRLLFLEGVGRAAATAGTRIHVNVKHNIAVQLKTEQKQTKAAAAFIATAKC